LSRILIDASTTLVWAFNEEGRGPGLTPLFRDHELVAPWLWGLEVTNAVLSRERRKTITEAVGVRILRVLEALDVEIIGEPADRSLIALAQLGRPHQLTAYDAAYFELAVRLGLPLLADDGNLRAAAERAGWSWWSGPVRRGGRRRRGEAKTPLRTQFS
jgi:predicted nucleic acid-binding protein